MTTKSKATAGKATAGPATAKASIDTGPRILKKLSTAKIIGRIKRPELGEYVTLYTVYGRAHDVKRGNSDNGPWLALVGSFEAHREDDGRLFYATTAFIPDMGEMLADKVSAGDGNNMVEFAVKVGIQGTDTPIGYEYVTEPLMKASGAEPLADLREQLALGNG